MSLLLNINDRNLTNVLAETIMVTTEEIKCCKKRTKIFSAILVFWEV
ncbi:hypothetical protein EDD71_10422 [Fonticella tunisiensis]|uniref:Uncharacterized protein n=1 Tax=Fonticella tunisiensis TaxID=1096341 RepID=A0A4R7KS15_9CLOT|nr:hypothetical protein EDD71_10422 [Fonticella tunisiensis]